MSAAVTTKIQPPKPPPEQSPALPAPSGRMSLAKVVKGRLQKPLRVLVYGIEGVGKSTFAASAPDAIFLGAEDGTAELDVARFPQPQSWLEALDAINELTVAEHDYKTLVIDTLDWLEPLCWTHTCTVKKDKKTGKRYDHIEDFGYGKGYKAALEFWRVLVHRIERLRDKRQMNLVMLAHSWIKSFKNPAGEDFDRYEMKVHSSASGLLREWSDDVLFATHKLYTHEQDGRAKGIMSDDRVVYTERTAAWDAKNRHDLPKELPLDWDAYRDAVQAHRPADPETLKARIEKLLGETSDDALIERVKLATVRAGSDAAELARIKNKLSATLSALATQAAEDEDEEAEEEESE